jgi:hypothetical protein
MAVIEKNCDGLTKPRRGQNQIRGVIAVNIARNDLKPAGRRDDQNPLVLAGGNLQPNPVVCQGNIASPGLNISQVGATVPVQVGNRKF